MARYTDAYIDRLLAINEFDTLVELQRILWSSPKRDAYDLQYGFPDAVFTFIESLGWFSQAIRSGTWTYFEATPNERQKAMYAQLRRFAPAELADQYRCGIEHWHDQAKMADVDRWISDNESTCNDWLFGLVLQNRDELRPLYA